MIVVPIDVVAAAKEITPCHTLLLATWRALDDLRALEFRDRAEHGQREFIFKIVDVVFAVDDDAAGESG